MTQKQTKSDLARQNKKEKQLVKCGNLHNVSMPIVFLIYNQGSTLRLVKACISQSNFFACLHFVSCVLMLPVSLDCSFLTAPSVFSNVYLLRTSTKTTLLVRRPTYISYQTHFNLNYLKKKQSCHTLSRCSNCFCKLVISKLKLKLL